MVLLHDPPEVRQFAQRGDPPVAEWPGRVITREDLMAASGDKRDWFRYGHRLKAYDRAWREFIDARRRRRNFMAGFDWNQILILGEYGSGKTSLGIKIARHFFGLGHPVFSNSRCAPHIGVQSRLGQIELTVMSKGANANAWSCVRMMTPDLDTLYGALVPVAILPATDAMLTILPCRRGFMCTITAFVTRTMPLTFTSKIWSQSSQVNSSRSSQPRAPIIPELLTRMSMRPNSAMTESTAASTDSWLVTSIRTPSDLRPAPAIAAAVSSASP